MKQRRAPHLIWKKEMATLPVWPRYLRVYKINTWVWLTVIVKKTSIVLYFGGASGRCVNARAGPTIRPIEISSPRVGDTIRNAV